MSEYQVIYRYRFIYFHLMPMSVLLHAFMCAACIPRTHGIQKVPHPLKLECSVVMSHYVISGDQTQVLCKNNKCSLCLMTSLVLLNLKIFVCILLFYGQCLAAKDNVSYTVTAAPWSH